VDIAVQHCLYWPDGTRKKHLRSQPIDTSRDSERQLVEALVDKYNDDHDLLGVCSLPLPLAITATKGSTVSIPITNKC
jgi:hypothetical protein